MSYSVLFKVLNLVTSEGDDRNQFQIVSGLYGVQQKTKQVKRFILWRKRLYLQVCVYGRQTSLAAILVVKQTVLVFAIEYVGLEVLIRL